jgi:hypothetical protein
MDEKHPSRASFAVILLLLLFLAAYVGSYLALADPLPYIVFQEYRPSGQTSHYRVGGKYAERFFWPLEQLDRKLRPRKWNPDGYVF